MNFKLNFVIFTYVVSVIVQVLCAKFDSNKFERKMIALMKVMKYMLDRPEQMNLDTTFGVTFAEANIQAALRHENVMFLDTYQKTVLLNILKVSDDTRRALQANEEVPKKDMAELSLKINNPEIWIKPISWRKMNVGKDLKPNPNLTLPEIIDSMFDGHPQEEESDSCLINLGHKCQLLDNCRNILVHNDSSTTGYPLTHKLLMLQIMNALHCETSMTPFYPYLSLQFCTLILQDLINQEQMRFPYVSKDLASEQVLLCGMEGYLEFVSEHYEQLILDWQHPSGCYSGMGGHINWDFNRRRVRRSGSFTDFGCINHATGLGAAVLALLIRKDIELFTESRI